LKEKSDPFSVNYWVLVPYILSSRLSETMFCFLDCHETTDGVGQEKCKIQGWIGSHPKYSL